jgi:DNA-binding transcriptional LysR family regulator
MSSPKVTEFRLDVTANLLTWRTFLAIAELGSLTRAALYLDCNQSMLSRQINALERECNSRLFVRTGRGVELTDVGKHIEPRVRALLSDAERLELELRSVARQPTGLVSIGLLPSVAHPLIRNLYSRLRTRCPEVHLKVLEGSSGQVDEWLIDGRVDIAILYRYGATLPDMEKALAHVDSYLIGAPGDRLTQAAEVSFASLDGLPFILPSAPNGLRSALDTLARREQVDLVPRLEADSLPLMKSIVAAEGIYTVLPLHAVWSEVSEGKLQAAKLVNPPLQRVVSMAEAKTKGPNRAVLEVVSLIEAIVDEMALEGMWHRGEQGPPLR